jgi:hypothetical protein
MQEIVVIFIILTAIAIAYLWIYPQFVGNHVKRMQIYDVVISLAAFVVVAAIYMGDDLKFTFIFFETNWAIFTVLCGVVLETPLFFWYLKARGLTREYFSLSWKTGNIWGNASVASVTKQLDDEKWDGLRTSSAKIFLLIASNLFLLGGTVFLILVGDNSLASYTLIHVLLIGVFWFLLRKSARLVADAPDQALDERLLQARNWAYLWSYRWMTFLMTLTLIVVMIFVISADLAPDSDGFRYQVEITWPQLQALWWLFLGYIIMLPSMSFLGIELRHKRIKQGI